MSWAIKNIGDERSFDRWGKPIEFTSLASFEDSNVSASGIYSIFEQGALVDLNIEVCDGKPLVIFFNGAQKRDTGIKLPIFSGLSVAPKGKVSRLSINDPCLYMSDDINMAWYVGSKYYSLQNSIVPRIIDKVVALANASNVIFVGGSAGGMASLYYARKFPGAFCITSNPQTNILDYYKPHVNRFLSNCLGVSNAALVKENPRIVGEAVMNIRTYYGGSVKNPTIYLQNIQDEHHVVRHFTPFIKSLKLKVPEEVGSKQMNNKLLVHLGDWGDGHKSAPREFWANMLNNVVENESQWEILFKEKRANELLQ